MSEKPVTAAAGGAVVKTEAGIGSGMSKKEAKKIRMQSMSKAERTYLRRKTIAEKVWPFFRFVILFGLGFVILYPLIYICLLYTSDADDEL